MSQHFIASSFLAVFVALAASATFIGCDKDAAPPPPPDKSAAGSPGGSNTASPGATNNTGGNNNSVTADFALLGSTEKGQTLFLKLAPGLTVEDSLKQTAQSLAKKLDDKPVITRAFSDSKKKDTGGATFTGMLKGQPVKGVMLCASDSGAGSANVVIASASASPAETKALMDFIPAPLNLTTTQFPDGSGSIDLPEGWHTPTQQAVNGIIAFGPAGQAVSFGVIQNISDPNCRTVRLSQQTYQIAQQMYQRQLNTYNARLSSGWPAGMPPTPPAPPEDPNETAMKQGSPLRYCRYCDGAEEVLKVYYPILADLGQRYNKPYTSVDKIIAVVPVGDSSGSAGMKMGVAYFAATDHYPDHEVHMRVVNQMLTQNTTPGESWTLITSVMRAPETTFEEDFPVMNAIQSSIKLNQAVVGREFASVGDMVRQSGQSAFDTMEKNHEAWQDQQASEFRSFQERMYAQQAARQQSALDMIEFAGGLRSVYDTETGQWMQVDLLNSDDIVGAMNWVVNDPNRYVQVPLRYLRTDMW